MIYILIFIDAVSESPFLVHVDWAIDFDAIFRANGLFILWIATAITIEQHFHGFLCLKTKNNSLKMCHSILVASKILTNSKAPFKSST